LLNYDKDEKKKQNAIQSFLPFLNRNKKKRG
jgi:hypothetical protein